MRGVGVGGNILQKVLGYPSILEIERGALHKFTGYIVCLLGKLKN